MSFIAKKDGKLRLLEACNKIPVLLSKIKTAEGPKATNPGYIFCITSWYHRRSLVIFNTSQLKSFSTVAEKKDIGDYTSYR